MPFESSVTEPRLVTPSLNAIAPEGTLPLAATCAVRITDCVTLVGFIDDVRVVTVAVGPDAEADALT